MSLHCGQVRMVKLLLRHKVQQKDIAVLSQYRSQCSALTGRLKNQNLLKVTVSTVIAAQGLLLLVAYSRRSQWPNGSVSEYGMRDFVFITTA